jgi:peroxiredoxin
MTRTRKPQPVTPTRASTNPKRRASWWSWAAIGIPIALLTAVVALGGGSGPDGTTAVGSPAPDFDLPATDGSRQSLDALLAKGEALLYFSMGPGCDGCFAQIPEVEDALAERGIILVPVMVDPAPLVAAEARRFGITRPILIDADRSVSEAYGMIGVYGHQDRPSHSFALVDQQGEISWIGHYAEMFLTTDRLLSDLDARA